jgi:predicted phosphoribosyltransferase
VLEKEADHIEVIIVPSISKFKSVKQYCQSFEATSDEQVIQIVTKIECYKRFFLKERS